MLINNTSITETFEWLVPAVLAVVTVWLTQSLSSRYDVKKRQESRRRDQESRRRDAAHEVYQNLYELGECCLREVETFLELEQYSRSPVDFQKYRPGGCLPPPARSTGRDQLYLDAYLPTLVPQFTNWHAARDRCCDGLVAAAHASRDPLESPPEGDRLEPVAALADSFRQVHTRMLHDIAREVRSIES